MAEEQSEAAGLQLLGGELCLDFANTVGNHKSDDPTDHLASYADLVAWSRHAGILTTREAQQLRDESTQHPATANNVFTRALAFREAIYHIFTAIAEDTSPKSADIDLVNESLTNGLAHSRLVSTKDGFRWGWTDETALDRMVWQIARSAADLLTSGNLDRVRQCGDAECGWLFVDTTKNRSRRWCDMNDCGNRAKARRYYKRMRGVK